MALGDPRGVERVGEVDGDLVVGLIHQRRVAGRDADHLRSLDQALGPQEPDRQLVLEPRCPEGDRDSDRVLAGSGGADLERLLADDAIRAELQGRAADGHDPGRRDVAGRERRRVGVHEASVRSVPRQRIARRDWAGVGGRRRRAMGRGCIIRRWTTT